MSKGIPILAVIVAGVVFACYHVSSKGYGVRQPVTEPVSVSVREGSVHRTGRRGRYFMPVFIGGGPRHGK